MRIISPFENDSEFHKAFETILSIESFSDHIKGIIGLVFNNSLDEKNLEEILKNYKIKNLGDIKEELLDLLIVYINMILNDGVITEKELQNAQYLKLIFGIQEGDFYKFRFDEIEDILSRQFFWMYRNDNKIDKTEALYRVSLQKLFNLGYDQFLDFNEKEIIAAMERGADIRDLDTAYDFSQIINLNSDKFSRRISQKVKDLVWNRDRGKCVICESNQNLEFDHIIPFSKGGSNTYRNIQLLCEKCNRKKYNKISKI